MSYVFCFSCVDRSVRRSSLSMYGQVRHLCLKCSAGVSDEFPVFARFGRTSRSRRLDERRKSDDMVLLCRFFSSVPWSKEWAVSCGVYLEC